MTTMKLIAGALAIVAITGCKKKEQNQAPEQGSAGSGSAQQQQAPAMPR